MKQSTKEKLYAVGLFFVLLLAAATPSIVDNILAGFGL